MKKTILSLAMLSVLSLSFLSTSAQAAPIATLDVQTVFEEADIAKEVAKELKEKTDKMRKRLESVDADLARREEELRKKRAAMTEEKFMEEAAELRRVSREYRSEFQAEQDKIRAKQRALNKKITDEIKSVVEALSKKKKFKAVIGKAYLIYADDMIDITEDVIKNVNKNLKDKKETKEGL